MLMGWVITFVLAFLHVIILTSEFLVLYLFQILREFFSVFDVDYDHHLWEGLCGNQTFRFLFAVFYPNLHIMFNFALDQATACLRRLICLAFRHLIKIRSLQWCLVRVSNEQLNLCRTRR